MTPAGRQRYNKPNNAFTKIKNKLSGKKKETKKTNPKKLIRKKKSFRDYSNAELKAMTNRLNLENNFKDALKRNTEISKGEKFVTHIAKQIVIPAVTNTARDKLDDYLHKALDVPNTSKKKKKKRK